MGRAQGAQQAVGLGAMLRHHHHAEDPPVRWAVGVYEVQRDGSRTPVSLPSGTYRELDYEAKFKRVERPLEAQLIRERRNRRGDWEHAETLQSFTRQPPHQFQDGMISAVDALRKLARDLRERPPGFYAEQAVSDAGIIRQTLTQRRFQRGDDWSFGEVIEDVLEEHEFDPDEDGATARADAQFADLRLCAFERNEQLAAADEGRELRVDELDAKRARARQLAAIVERSTAEIETAAGSFGRD